MRRSHLAVFVAMLAPSPAAADSFYERTIAERDGAIPCFARIYDAVGDAGSFKLTPRLEGVLVVIDERLYLEGHVSWSPDLAKDGDDSPILLRPSPTADCHFE